MDNAALLDGVAANTRGDHGAAVSSLSEYTARNEFEPLGRLYLASALLSAGRPFDAELELDHLEQMDAETFNDQIAWYRTLCFLCSDQRARAMRSAAVIASSPVHTYKAEAARLMEDLRNE